MPEAVSATGLERVLFVHARYRQRGGEDTVVDAEIALLRSHGHAVELYERSNAELEALGRVRAGARAVWNAGAAHELAAAIARFRPDIVHVHNTFPSISPSIYAAATRAGVPVVQTLHNFRLLCPQAMFLREGRVCEDCVGHLPWRSVTRACYHDSRAQSAMLTALLGVHRWLGTWRRHVGRFVALNEFCRRKFVEGGLPAERIVVKPNFVDAPQRPDPARPRDGLLFVGRLSAEKGIDVLRTLALQMPEQHFRVAGDGPLRERLTGLPNLTLLGALPFAEVCAEMRAARALLLPSIWYENFPRTLVEAFACGLPVVASRLGAMADIVTDQQTGLLFEPGDAADLARVLRAGLADLGRMGATARTTYEALYSPVAAYAATRELYDGVPCPAA